MKITWDSFKTDELNLDDYKVGDEVEIFGLGEEGLIYFITTITEKEDNLINIKYPTDVKNIQRREGTDVVSMKLFFWMLKEEKSPRRVMKRNLEIFSKDLWKKSTIICFWQLNLRWDKDLGTENHYI